MDLSSHWRCLLGSSRVLAIIVMIKKCDYKVWSVDILILLSLFGCLGAINIQEQNFTIHAPETAKKLIVKVTSKNSFGAGIIVGARTNLLFIATANHIINSPQYLDVEFEFWRGTVLQADLIYSDNKIDLAVLRVNLQERELADSDIPPIPFELIGAKSSIERGEDVYLIGHPLGVPWDVSVSPVKIKKVVAEEVWFEPACFSGHSGGGIFNTNWALVGMIIQDKSAYCEAISFDRIQATLKEDLGLLMGGMQNPDVPEARNLTEEVLSDSKQLDLKAELRVLLSSVEEILREFEDAGQLFAQLDKIITSYNHRQQAYENISQDQNISAKFRLYYAIIARLIDQQVVSLNSKKDVLISERERWHDVAQELTLALEVFEGYLKIRGGNGITKEAVPNSPLNQENDIPPWFDELEEKFLAFRQSTRPLADFVGQNSRHHDTILEDFENNFQELQFALDDNSDFSEALIQATHEMEMLQKDYKRRSLDPTISSEWRINYARLSSEVALYIEIFSNSQIIITQQIEELHQTLTSWKPHEILSLQRNLVVE